MRKAKDCIYISKKKLQKIYGIKNVQINMKTKMAADKYDVSLTGKSRPIQMNLYSFCVL